MASELTSTGPTFLLQNEGEGKVIFSQVCVSHSVHGKEISV